MKKTFYTALTISAFSLGLVGCSGSVGYTPATANTTTAAAKPVAANTASNTAPKTTADSNAAKSADKPTAVLKDEKKPEGKSKTAGKDVPIPDSWIYVSDEAKGYGFSVPEGTTGGSETQEGVDTYVANTPAPSEIGVVVIAFKDKQMTKENLLDVAVKFIEGMGEKVQPGKLAAESDDYSLAEATMTAADGKKSKCKILVGTDVTDNYVMVVGAAEDKFAANEKVIDEIWGSFEIWSGGASKN